MLTRCAWSGGGGLRGDGARAMRGHEFGRLRHLSDLFHLLLDHLTHFSQLVWCQRLGFHPIVHLHHPRLHLLLILFHLASHDSRGRVGLTRASLFFRPLLVDALLHLPTPRLIFQPILPFRVLLAYLRTLRGGIGRVRASSRCTDVVVIICFVVYEVMPEREGCGKWRMAVEGKKSGGWAMRGGEVESGRVKRRKEEISVIEIAVLNFEKL